MTQRIAVLLFSKAPQNQIDKTKVFRS